MSSYEIPSEQLLISSRPGKTSFVTPSVETKFYYVFVFLDNNEDGYFEMGEPGTFYKIGNEPIPIAINGNETNVIS